MKTTNKILLIILTSLLIFFTNKVGAQTKVKINSKGQFEQVQDSSKVNTDAITDQEFVDKKGNIFPIYETKNRKMYIKRISAKGNEYKQFLKLEN